MLPALIALLDISIHALVKRATGFCVAVLFHVRYFNPRPREEGDPGQYYTVYSKILFQSTPS